MIELVGGIATGVLGNFATKALEAIWGKKRFSSEEPEEPEEPKYEPEMDDAYLSNNQPPKLFETFHIKTGFKDILNYIDDPIVHAIVEDSPSTAYHLVTLVIESQKTGEWFVSGKSEMAFEGGGGGHMVSERVVAWCAERHVKLTPWVLDHEKAELLSSGCLHWNEAKPLLLPLLTYAKSEYFIDRIAQRYRELTA